MVKINRKTRKIKRTKKFNRKQNKVLIGGRGQLSQEVKLKITYVIFESVKKLLTDYKTENKTIQNLYSQFKNEYKLPSNLYDLIPASIF